jgi:hypothetical protein
MNELNNLSSSLEKTIKDTDLQNVTIDLAETITDSFFNDGIGKDIPILGTIIGLAKSAINLKDRLFIKKLIYFLVNLNSIPKTKRKEMIDLTDSSDKYTIKVGEKLLYIIDKCDDHKSAEKVGKLFNTFLNDSITYSEFLRAATIIDKVFSEDLELFLKESTENLEKADPYNEDPFSDFQHRLVNAGLLSSSIDPISVEDQDDWKMSDRYVVRGGKASVYLTEIGSTLKKYL